MITFGTKQVKTCSFDSWIQNNNSIIDLICSKALQFASHTFIDGSSDAGGQESKLNIGRQILNIYANSWINIKEK